MKPNYSALGNRHGRGRLLYCSGIYRLRGLLVNFGDSPKGRAAVQGKDGPVGLKAESGVRVNSVEAGESLVQPPELIAPPAGSST